MFLCHAALTLGQLLAALQRDACCAADVSVLADIQSALEVQPLGSLPLLAPRQGWQRRPQCLLLRHFEGGQAGKGKPS